MNLGFGWRKAFLFPKKGAMTTNKELKNTDLVVRL